MNQTYYYATYISYNLPYEKVGKNEPVCIADEVPFEIPDSWEWVRCSTIGNMVRGKGIKRGETVPTGLPCIRYGEIYTTYNTTFSKTVSFIPNELDKKCNHIQKGDVVFTLTGENKPDIAKAIAYLGDEPVAAGGDLAYWTYHGMEPLYLTYYLNSPYCIEQKKCQATGDIIVHISTGKVGNFLLPVPPVEEQKRIINRILELNPLLEEYENKQSKVEILTKNFPDILKKSILQQAVMGKLVPQDPNDEPASVLLDKIRAEKESIIKAGKLKKDKHESIIYRRDNSHYEKLDGVELCIDAEIPFEIPETWSWARLSSLGITQTGNTPSKAHPEYFGQNIPFVGPGDIQGACINYENQGLSELGREYGRIVSTGSVLQVCIGGSIGKAAVSCQDVSFNQQINAITPICVNVYYLFYAMTAPYFIKSMREQAGGTATPIINRGVWDRMLIPIPPLNEQLSIIRIIKDSFHKCNQL